MLPLVTTAELIRMFRNQFGCIDSHLIPSKRNEPRWSTKILGICSRIKEIFFFCVKKMFFAKRESFPGSVPSKHRRGRRNTRRFLDALDKFDYRRPKWKSVLRNI